MIQEPSNEQNLDLRFKKIPFEERVPDYKIDLGFLELIDSETVESSYKI